MGALLCVGLVAVYSASFVIGLADQGDANYYILRQAAWAIVGLGALLFFMHYDYHHLRWLCLPVMLLCLAGLLLTMVPGIAYSQNGADRWIKIGPAPPLQPSEFAKLAVVMYVATWLSSKGSTGVRDWRSGFFPFFVMMTLIGFLLMQQPDLGTGVVIIFVMVAMFWVAGASVFQMITLGLTFAMLGLLLVGVGGYNSERITAFLNAESDPGGLGFQTLQLEIAFGSGGLTGLGLGESRQKFFYVPGAHTDGIFAIIGEEAGLLGAFAVLLLFVLLVWRGFRIAYRARESFGQLLAVGIVSWIAIQALLNMGGMSRAIPMTGIPLPLISFGGSALLSTMAALGILVSISRYGRQGDEPPERERAPVGQAGLERRPARRGMT